MSWQTAQRKVSSPSFKLLCQVPGRSKKKGNQYTLQGTCRQESGAENNPVRLRGDRVARDCELHCPHPGWSHCPISAPDFIAVYPAFLVQTDICVLHSYPWASTLHVLNITLILHNFQKALLYVHSGYMFICYCIFLAHVVQQAHISVAFQTSS